MTGQPAILERLQGVQRSGPGWVAFCPGHEDRAKRSLSVKLAADGRSLVHCFAGCPPERVVAAVNMSLADLAPAASIGRNGHGRPIAATYEYRDESNALIFQVIRFE